MADYGVYAEAERLDRIYNPENVRYQRCWFHVNPELRMPVFGNPTGLLIFDGIAPELNFLVQEGTAFLWSSKCIKSADGYFVLRPRDEESKRDVKSLIRTKVMMSFDHQSNALTLQVLDGNQLYTSDVRQNTDDISSVTRGHQIRFGESGLFKYTFVPSDPNMTARLLFREQKADTKLLQDVTRSASLKEDTSPSAKRAFVFYRLKQLILGQNHRGPVTKAMIQEYALPGFIEDYVRFEIPGEFEKDDGACSVQNAVRPEEIDYWKIFKPSQPVQPIPSIFVGEDAANQRLNQGSNRNNPIDLMSSRSSSDLDEIQVGGRGDTLKRSVRTQTHGSS